MTKSGIKITSLFLIVNLKNYSVWIILFLALQGSDQLLIDRPIKYIAAQGPSKIFELIKHIFIWLCYFLKVISNLIYKNGTFLLLLDFIKPFRNVALRL